MDILTAAHDLANEIGFVLIVDEDRSKRPTFVVINPSTGKSFIFDSIHEATGYLKGMGRFIKEQDKTAAILREQ